MAGSIAFIDESGDLGRRPGKGSSTAFVLAIVVFTDRAEAERCRLRIAALRAQLGKAPGHEFHFASDGHATRLAFLNAIARFDFRYYAVLLPKRPGRVTRAKESYLLACADLFTLAREALDDALVVIDGSGDRRYRRTLAAAVRQRAVAAGVDRIRDVRIHASETDSLLQLADYAAGIVMREMEARPGAQAYADLLAQRKGGIRVL